MIPRYLVLRERIEAELIDIERVGSKAAQAYQEARQSDQQMALKVEGVRPAVIRDKTAASLAEYLRFRHLVRNLYTWSFEEDKLGELIAGLDSTLADLKADLTGFGRYLEAASRADEIGES